MGLYTDVKTRRFEGSTAFDLVPGGSNGTPMHVNANTPSSSRNLTVIDPGADDTFLFVSATQNLGNKTLTTNLAAGGFKVTGLGDPTSAQDAATKNYVDNVAQGMSPKESVQAATTANISLSGNQTIDGYSTSTNDRILVKNQSTPSQNGIYAANSGAWTRTIDFDDANDAVPGPFVCVLNGTTNTDTIWLMYTNTPYTIGTTSLSWTQMNSGSLPGTVVQTNQTNTYGAYIQDFSAGNLVLPLESDPASHAGDIWINTSLLKFWDNAGTPVKHTIAVIDTNNLFTANQSPSSAGGNSLGTAALPWSGIYVGNAATNNTSWSSTVSAARVFSTPDANSNSIQPLGSATSHQWVQYTGSDGVQHLSQPAFTDISGTATSGQLPATIVYNNQANTYTTGGLQDFSAMTMKMPSLVLIGNTDTGIARNATGIIEINSGNAGQFGTELAGIHVAEVLAQPGVPTVTTNGTTGSTTWGYEIVAKLADGTTTQASTQGTTTSANGNATLSGGNYQAVTWSAVTGATSYDVYRTSAPGTPSTTGKIGNTTSTSLNDTGLVGDGTTAPSVNNTGAYQAGVAGTSVDTGLLRSAQGMFEVDSSVQGNWGGLNLGFLDMRSLANPASPTVAAQGTTGATNWAYTLVATDASGNVVTASPSSTSISNGNATLNGSHYNKVSWSSITGASFYKIYRTTAGGTPSSTGLIATVAYPNLFYNDQGAAGDSSSPPVTNNTGSILFATDNVASIGASGANRPAAIYCAGTVTANSLTLGTALSIGNGGTGQTTATTAFNALSPMTTLGDIIYGGSSPAGQGTRLAGSTSATKNFLTQTGNGTISAAPSWGTIASGDVPPISLTTVGSNGGITNSILGISNGGTGQSTASAALSALGGMPWPWTINLQTNTNYTVATTDIIVPFSTGASTRTATLPAPGSGNKGFPWLIGKVDSGAGNVVLSPAGGNINGVSTITIDQQGDWYFVFNDGSNYWTL